MFVARKELFELLDLPRQFGNGGHLVMEPENGSRRAVISWNGIEFSADVTETIEGEASEPIVVLSGTYSQKEDGFEIEAVDHRLEASDRKDARSAANAIRMLTSDMAAIGQ